MSPAGRWAATIVSLLAVGLGGYELYVLWWAARYEETLSYRGMCWACRNPVVIPAILAFIAGFILGHTIWPQDHPWPADIESAPQFGRGDGP